MNVFGHCRFPIMAALYHPPGGIIRHDAVVWAYARGADRGGAHIHQRTRVTGIEVQEGAVQAVITDRGRIAAGTVVNATAGYASTTVMPPFFASLWPGLNSRGRYHDGEL